MMTMTMTMTMTMMMMMMMMMMMIVLEKIVLQIATKSNQITNELHAFKSMVKFLDIYLTFREGPC